MDAEFKFSRHTEIQVNKANRIVGVIRRTFSHLEKKTLKQLFISLVRPHLEYAITTWSPRFIKDKELIENVLRRTTKLIADIRDLEYTVRLRKLEIPSMNYRRTRGDMIEVWKFLNGKYNINTDLLNISSESITRGHSLKLNKPRCITSVRQHFFSQRVIAPWNSLPEYVISAENLNSFKNRLDDHWDKHIYTDNLRFPYNVQGQLIV